MQMPEPMFFRATKEAWLGQLLLPLVFFLVLILTVMARTDLPVWVGALGLGFLLTSVIFRYAMPMLRHWIRLDARSLEGFYRGQYFEVFWGEVLAAWVWENHRAQFLCLGTRQGTIILPLQFFDDRAVWQAVQHCVPPAALEADSLLRLPDYQRWQAVAPKVNAAATAVVDHGLVQIFDWVGLTVAIFAASQYLLTAAWVGLGVSLVFVGLFALLLTRWGVSEFSRTGVVRHTLFEHRAIAWDAIRWVEMDPVEGTLVLVGDDCRLVLSGPLFWSSGAGKQAALALLMTELAERRISIRRTPLALLRLSSRTRRE